MVLYTCINHMFGVYENIQLEKRQFTDIIWLNDLLVIYFIKGI